MSNNDTINIRITEDDLHDAHNTCDSSDHDLRLMTFDFKLVLTKSISTLPELQ